MGGDCTHLPGRLFHGGHRLLDRFRQLVHVALAHGDARVSHQLLDDMGASTRFSQPGPERVSEGVEAHGILLDHWLVLPLEPRRS